MMHDTLVIGAGVAGLAAAGRLRQAGQDVLVLEKSRGVGGRAATRRWDGLPVDHGAQFFTARSEAFRAQVAQWQDDGVCHPWANGFHQHHHGQLEPASDDGHPRFACRHGMSALGRALADADSLVIEREAKVVAIRAESESWILSDDRARTFRGRRLIMTAPTPQGAALLQDVAPRAAAVLQSFTLHPCLAVVAKYPRRALAWHGIQSDSAEIAWMGHDTSKRPDAHAGQTVIVVHASADFSRRHYEAAEHDITRALLAHASGIAGEDLGAPDGTFLQRWRYATLDASTDADPAVAVDAPAPLVLAGESFGGGRIEGAWLSGVHAAALASQPRGEHPIAD